MRSSDGITRGPGDESERRAELRLVRAGDVEIKRDMEQERDEVRIMTVHGAKGLQAPIVFLPDTCTTAAGGPVSTLHRFTPLARSAVISLSCDSRPNVMSTATRTPQGTESATT
jgi:ATP-dependent exoDNAse (exonuclease V) beta subunit